MVEEKKKKCRRDPRTKPATLGMITDSPSPVPRPFALLFLHRQPSAGESIVFLPTLLSLVQSIPASRSVQKELIPVSSATLLPFVADNVARFCSLTFRSLSRPFLESSRSRLNEIILNARIEGDALIAKYLCVLSTRYANALVYIIIYSKETILSPYASRLKFSYAIGDLLLFIYMDFSTSAMLQQSLMVATLRDLSYRS